MCKHLEEDVCLVEFGPINIDDFIDDFCNDKIKIVLILNGSPSELWRQSFIDNISRLVRKTGDARKKERLSKVQIEWDENEITVGIPFFNDYAFYLQEICEGFALANDEVKQERIDAQKRYQTLLDCLKRLKEDFGCSQTPSD